MNEELKKYVEYQLKYARQLGDLVFKHNAYGAVNWELIREKDEDAKYFYFPAACSWYIHCCFYRQNS